LKKVGKKVDNEHSGYALLVELCYYPEKLHEIRVFNPNPIVKNRGNFAKGFKAV